MKQIFNTKRYGLIIETVCTPADGKKVNKPVVQVHVTAPNKVGFLQLKELHAYLVETLVGGNGIEPKLLMDGSLSTRRSSWSIKTSRNDNTISVEIMAPVNVNVGEFITPLHGKLAIFLGNSLGDQDADTTPLIARPTTEYVVFKHHYTPAAETANLMVIPQSLHTLPISGLHSPAPKISATLLIAKAMGPRPP